MPWLAAPARACCVSGFIGGGMIVKVPVPHTEATVPDQVPFFYPDLVHVYPLFGRAHDTASYGVCWCHPEIEVVSPYAAIITHNGEH